MTCTHSFSDSAKKITTGSTSKPFLLKFFFRCVMLCFLLPVSMASFAQFDDDVSTAERYSRKFKEDAVLCQSSYRYFTFDKGKNSLNDKVVTIEENAEYE